MPPHRPVTYMCPNGALEIRMTEQNFSVICEAARNLKARYFIAQDGWSDMEALPIWGVFDMRTAQRDTPTPRQWSVSDPVRTFTTETPDAAVMYALALMGRS